MPRRASLLAAVLCAALAVAGCGGDDAVGPAAGPATPATSSTSGAPSTSPTPGAPSTSGASSAPGAPPTPGAPATMAGSGPPAGTGATAGPDAASGASSDDAVPAPPRRWTATCPTKTKSPMGCRAVRGRVLAVQSYDPDGDGDLHVVAVGGDVTAPGITVFDVRASLRPRRDPVKGEYVTGAGPVFRGSLGQRQIQVDAFRVWRPRR